VKFALEISYHPIFNVAARCANLLLRKDFTAVESGAIGQRIVAVADAGTGSSRIMPIAEE
jgi:hypothetical protein